ncbi:methyltransferase domain-containing protein [Acidobacteriota bacterium]
MVINEEDTEFTYSGKEVLDEQKVLKKYNQYILKQFIDIIRDKDNVLDFGAGIGTFANLIDRKKINLECVEKDSQQMEYLKKNGFMCFPGLPEKKNHYELVYSINVLEHIEDDQTILENIYSIVKPGGHLVLWVPAFQILYSSFDKRVGHLRRYSRKELEEKLINSGYSIKSAKYKDSLGWLVTLVFKLFGSKKGHINMRILLFYSNVLLYVSRLMDKILSPFMGKNIVVIAKKPGSPSD